jgi:hypothetical protein
VRTRISLLIPAVALATALAACGDSAPSKAAFVTKADAACAPGNTSISTTAKPTNAPQVATAAGSAADTINSQVKSLQALKLPGGKDKTTMQTLITSIGDVAAPTRALQDAAGKTDDAAMAKAALDMQAKADAAANWGGLAGMGQCGTQLKFGLGNMFDGVKNVVKASFILKAENLCREYYRKSDAVTVPGNSAASFAKYLDAEQALSTKLVSDLRAVTIPPGDEATVGDFLGSMESLNNKANDLIAATKNNPRLVNGLIDELNVASTAVNAKLDAYGLKVCGSAGG